MILMSDVYNCGTSELMNWHLEIMYDVYSYAYIIYNFIAASTCFEQMICTVMIISRT